MFFRSRRRVTGWEIPRFFFMLFTSSAGWIVIGIGLLIGGLIWGLNSHQVRYQTYPRGLGYHVGQGTTTGNVYINADGSNDYFAAFFFDFTPTISSDDLDRYASVSFVARTDTTTLNPPLNATNGTTITVAHKIEELVFYDQDGNIIRTYKTAEFMAYPNGYDANYWLYGGSLILLGVLAAGNGSFFLVRNRQRRKLAVQAELARLEATPSPFARELGQMPNPQTYQGFGQYPPPNRPGSPPYQAPQE